MTVGNSRAIWPANAQWVVAMQPSIKPACAARKASGADADHAAGVLGRYLDPADGVGVVSGVVDPDPAGQHQGVDRFARIG